MYAPTFKGQFLITLNIFERRDAGVQFSCGSPLHVCSYYLINSKSHMLSTWGGAFLGSALPSS